MTGPAPADRTVPLLPPTVTGGGPVAPRPRTVEPGVRLALSASRSDPNLLDGVWWPHSPDLHRGLPDLLTALEERWPGISRVSFGRSLRAIRPGALFLNGRVVHVSRSETARPHTICLVSYGVGRCDLLVIPPYLPPDAAHPAAQDVPSPRTHPPTW